MGEIIGYHSDLILHLNRSMLSHYEQCTNGIRNYTNPDTRFGLLDLRLDGSTKKETNFGINFTPANSLAKRVGHDTRRIIDINLTQHYYIMILHSNLDLPNSILEDSSYVMRKMGFNAKKD